MTIQQLITNHLDIWTAADTEKKSGRGKSSGNAGSVYGIKKLRELILELAVRGKLVPQDESDEPASELLKRIVAEKGRLVAEGKIKKSKPLAEITDDEKPFELPVGWEWVRLGQIAEANTGYAFKSSEYVSAGTFVLRVTNINIDSSLDLTDAKYIDSEAAASTYKNFLLNEDDILLVMVGGSLGKLGVVDKSCLPAVLNQNMWKMVRSDGLTKDYFLYGLRHINSTQIVITSSTHGHLAQGEYLSKLFPLPPLAEQHRIVAKVDELMALCDQLENQHINAAEAHEKLVTHLLGTLTQSQLTNTDSPLCKRGAGGDFNWQRISEHFDTLFTTEASIDALKQTLLQLAVMGKLVPQDPNDEPASELLKRIQAEKAKLIAEGKIKKDKPLAEISEEEKPFDLPVGWEWARLQSVIDVRDGTHDSPKEAIGANTFPLVTSKDFADGDINFDSAKRISEVDHIEISKRSLVEKYDILFSMIGGNIGNQIIVLDDRSFSIKNVALFKYYNRTLTFPFFIKKYTENLAVTLQTTAIGGAQPFVALGALRNLVIALPPIEEQHHIVTKVDELMTFCDQLKARITLANQLQQKIADVVIEQAILQ